MKFELVNLTNKSSGESATGVKLKALDFLEEYERDAALAKENLDKIINMLTSDEGFYVDLEISTILSNFSKKKNTYVIFIAQEDELKCLFA